MNYLIIYLLINKVNYNYNNINILKNDIFVNMILTLEEATFYPESC